MHDTTPDDTAIIAALADELLFRLPALQELAALRREVANVTSREGRIRFDIPALVPLEVVERAYVEHTLSYYEGNKSQAAVALGIDPSTLYRKLNRWGL